MYFADNDDYQKILDFTPMLSSLRLHNNKNVTNWI